MSISTAKTIADWNAEGRVVIKGQRATGFTPEHLPLFRPDQTKPMSRGRAMQMIGEAGYDDMDQDFELFHD